MSFRETVPPPNHPPGALPLDPAGGLPFPIPPVPPTSKSWLRHWPSSYDYCFLCVIGHFVVQITVNFMPSHNRIILSDDHYSAPSRECSIVMNMSASLSASILPGITRPILAFCVCYAWPWPRPLWWRCDTLYVLAFPVLQITSCLHVRREKTCTQSDSEGTERILHRDVYSD